MEEIDTRKIEFWKDQFKIINWNDEFSLDKKSLIDFQSNKQVVCSRLGQVVFTKQEREQLIAQFRGSEREHVEDLIQRYALKD